MEPSGDRQFVMSVKFSAEITGLSFIVIVTELAGDSHPVTVSVT